jgi:hypothetical protein
MWKSSVNPQNVSRRKKEDRRKEINKMEKKENKLASTGNRISPRMNLLYD